MRGDYDKSLNPYEMLYLKEGRKSCITQILLPTPSYSLRTICPGVGGGCFCSYFLHFLVLFPEFFVPKTSPLPCWNSVAAPGVHTHYSLLAYNFAYPEFEPAILHLHIIADWVLLMVALHTPAENKNVILYQQNFTDCYKSSILTHSNIFINLHFRGHV